MAVRRNRQVRGSSLRPSQTCNLERVNSYVELAVMASSPHEHVHPLVNYIHILCYLNCIFTLTNLLLFYYEEL